jgi:tetratricopeptide (TPR) repeat protein
VRGGAFRDLPALEEVDRVIAEGLAAATDLRERAALLMAAAVMAIRWSVQGRPDPVPIDQRLAAAREADAIANDLGDPTLAFEVADVLADLYAMTGDVGRALETITTAIPLIERVRSPARRAGALFEAGQSLLNGGQPARGLELAQQSLDLAANLSAHDQMHATSVIITAADWLGDWDLAEAALAGHLANFEGESTVRCLNVQSGPNRGALVVARRGDVERARSLVGRPIPFEATPGPVQSAAAEVMVAAGLPEEGLAIARDVLERSARWRQPIAAGAALHAHEALEDWDALGRLAADLEDLRPASPYLDALIDRAAGRSMLAQGDREAGLGLLRRALAKFERIPVVFEAAMTRETLAAALPDERERFLRAALATYEGLRAEPSVLRVIHALATA